MRISTIFFLLIFFAGGNALFAQSVDGARALIDQVIAANGSLERLHALGDVSLHYTLRDVASGNTDVSVERYIFDGEHSFAHYLNREMYAAPGQEGTYTQFYNGKETVTRLNEEVLTEQAAYVGHFLRKTNFYWFTMMFKLGDPGVQLRQLDDRLVEGTDYHAVEMTFADGTGETSDRYILYVNPRTHLVDQFLFTVKGFGITDPMLMKLAYEEIDGLQLSTYRKYAPANWDGEVVNNEAWTEQITQNIRFGNGFTAGNFRSDQIEERVSLNRRIDLPANQVWAKIRNFETAADLVPALIDRVAVEGGDVPTGWVIYLKNGATVTEAVTDFDDHDRSMTYRMTDTPMPLRDYLATISVTPLGSGSSLVTFKTDFAAEMGPRKELAGNFRNFQKTYLGNIDKLFVK